jgi:hypothetical protein
MRKGAKRTKTERAIAYSRHSSVQVYVRTIPLSEMMTSKIAALTRQDYNVKLCSLLEADQRPYYRQNNFRILKSHQGMLDGGGLMLYYDHQM